MKNYCPFYSMFLSSKAVLCFDYSFISGMKFVRLKCQSFFFSDLKKKKNDQFNKKV